MGVFQNTEIHCNDNRDFLARIQRLLTTEDTESTEGKQEAIFTTKNLARHSRNQKIHLNHEKHENSQKRTNTLHHEEHEVNEDKTGSHFLPRKASRSRGTNSRVSETRHEKNKNLSQ